MGGIEYIDASGKWLVTIEFSLTENREVLASAIFLCKANCEVLRRFKSVSMDAASGSPDSMKTRAVSEMLAIQPSGALLLDTNLLLLLFIGWSDTSLIKKAKTLSAYTEECYEPLQEFVSLNSFTSLLATPHIIAEVSNLLAKE